MNLAARRLPAGSARHTARRWRDLRGNPYEISFCFANGLTWAPHPLLQSYVAYTAGP